MTARWRLDREPRAPMFTLAVGFGVSRETVTLLLLFWRLTWRREQEQDPFPPEMRAWMPSDDES